MKKHFKWLIPLLLILGIAPFTPEFDLTITRYFYTPELDSKGHFVNNLFTTWMFQYGEQLGFIVWGSAAAFYFLTWIVASLKKYRKGALVMVLTFVLGAGVIVNLGLKQYWGRPRPKQVVEFGGHHAFRPFYQPNLDPNRDPQKSFPSGHASTGFYYLALCLIAYRYRSRLLMGIGLVMGGGMGIALSLARIAQGAHFFSDTLFSFLIMWLTALLIDWLIHEFIPELKHDKMHLP